MKILKIASLICVFLLTFQLFAFIQGISIGSVNGSLMKRPDGKTVIIADVYATGWEEKASVHFLIGTEQGLGNINSHLGVIGKEGDNYSVVLPGSGKNSVIGNKVRIEIPFEGQTIPGAKYLTVYARSITGVESNKISVKLQ